MKSQKKFKPCLAQLGERIHHLRVVKNLTTKDFAHQLSLTSEALRNIEKGESDPSFTTLVLIAEILKIKFTELIKGICK